MAKCGITNISGGGGIGSDELSATKDYVLSGKTYVGADTNDEIGAGTMEDKSGSTTNYSSLDDTTGNIGNISSLTDLSSGGDSSLRIECLIAKGYHDGKSKASIRLWGVDPSNVKAGRSIGYPNNSLKGTFTSDANAKAPQILNGYTAYVNGNKITGTMNIQSILSFSVAPYSANQLIFTWKNPAMGPFSGVIIVGKTGAYPTSITDGTRYYKGFGNNSSANGTSNATVSGFEMGTAYYFRAFSYAVKDNTEWISGTTFISNATIQWTTKIFTSSQTFTIPNNVRTIDVFCVGGGAGGRRGDKIDTSFAGAGAHGGATATTKNNAVAPGGVLSIVVGSGGVGGTEGTDYWGGNGGSTTVTYNSNVICTAIGGSNFSIGGKYTGSGGGSGVYVVAGNARWSRGGDGGSDGGWGYSNQGYRENEGNETQGQGTTTRAFGESNGTLYSGGGGGGGNGGDGGKEEFPGEGGLGGGGGGGMLGLRNAQAGAQNTGGGGGAGACGYGYVSSSVMNGGSGGSGICIIRYIG